MPVTSKRSKPAKYAAVQIAALRSWRRKLTARILHRGITFGPGVWLDRGTIIETYDGGTIAIGADTHIHAGSKIVASGGHIRIGRGGLVHIGCTIISTARIDIGHDALIAEHVTIRDQDHGTADNGIPYALQGRITVPVVIGDNVWLGAKVTVTRGVDIPAGTIVGANSVVTKSLSGARIFAGAPARPLVRKEPA